MVRVLERKRLKSGGCQNWSGGRGWERAIWSIRIGRFSSKQNLVENGGWGNVIEIIAK